MRGLAIVAALLACGCRTPAARRMEFPPGMAAAPVASEKETPARRPYVVRMAEGGRVWEVELPEDAFGYEVRIPLGPDSGTPRQVTDADRELLGATAVAATTSSGGEGETKQPLAAPSYLGGVARVNELFASHRYELALIEVVELERSFPQDARLAAMKGSLFVKLGKPALAREAYQRSLQLNPDDVAVAEALLAIDSLEGGR